LTNTRMYQITAMALNGLEQIICSIRSDAVVIEVVVIPRHFQAFAN